MQADSWSNSISEPSSLRQPPPASTLVTGCILLRTMRGRPVYFLTFLCLLVTLANGPCNVQPQRITATATVSGLDGLSHETAEPFTLTHNVGQAATPRVVTKRIVLPQVKHFKVSVTRTGIPIDETFMLINISRQGFAPGGGAPPTTVAEDATYITDHVGTLESVSADTGRLDSPLTAERRDVFAGRQRTGYTLFARWNKNDPCMPFTDALALTDVSRLVTPIFTGLSGALMTADANSDKFSLGGPANDGNFEMYFVPHTQHSSMVSFGMPWNGFTLIFKATINAGTVSADVYLPLSILFTLLPGGSGTANLDARIDLLDLGTDSDDRKRVTVTAEGFLDNVIASSIRDAMLNAIDTMPQAKKEPIFTALGLFAAALNSLRPHQGQSPLPENTRVVLFPGVVPNLNLNRVAPAAVSLQPTLCVLQSR